VLHYCDSVLSVVDGLQHVLSVEVVVVTRYRTPPVGNSSTVVTLSQGIPPVGNSSTVVVLSQGTPPVGNSSTVVVLSQGTIVHQLATAALL